MINYNLFKKIRMALLISGLPKRFFSINGIKKFKDKNLSIKSQYTYRLKVFLPKLLKRMFEYLHLPSPLYCIPMQQMCYSHTKNIFSYQIRCQKIRASELQLYWKNFDILNHVTLKTLKGRLYTKICFGRK